MAVATAAKAGMKGGHGAQDADAALQHDLRGGHARHERELRVVRLDGQRRPPHEPVTAVEHLDLVFGPVEARAAALTLQRQP